MLLMSWTMEGPIAKSIGEYYAGLDIPEDLRAELATRWKHTYGDAANVVSLLADMQIAPVYSPYASRVIGERVRKHAQEGRNP